ncbi:MAG: hypothetical protein IJ837_02025 [Clostridia bacterium]|nr:hypothetical protein [Clostridia bacterium]
MNAVAKKTTYIIAIVLACGLLIAGICLLAYSKPAKAIVPDVPEVEQESGFTVKFANNTKSFYNKYTGEALPITTDDITIKVGAKDITSEAEFYYKLNGADNSAYTKTAPTEVNEYVVKVVIPETDMHKKFVNYYVYNIATEKTPTASMNPKVYYDRNGGESSFYEVYGLGSDITDYITIKVGEEDITQKAQFSYKALGADDSTYTTKKPTEIREYVVKVVVPATELYDGFERTYNFVIEKAEFYSISYHITCKNGNKIYKAYTGEALPITTNDLTITAGHFNDITDRIEFYYKALGADDSTYTETAPTEAGEYVVKVVVPATESYDGFEEVYNYTIKVESGWKKATKEFKNSSK